MMQSALPADDTSALLEIANRFAEAKCLLTADELGLFGLLEEGPATTAQISVKLGLRDHAAPDFLHVLVALGILEKTGEDTFANSPAAARYLVPGGAEYLGSLFKHRNGAVYPAWGRLAELITEPDGGDADGSADGNARQNFSAMLDDPARLRQMLEAMDRLNAFMGPALAEAFDWGGHESVVDLGGANGRHVTDILAVHPHLRGGVFDLPQLSPHADEQAAAAGVADRFTFHPGDFFADDFPPASVYVLGHILHNFGPATRRELVAKAYRALRPGGAVLVVDRMLDEQRATLARLIESLHLYVISEGGGSEYRPSDCAAYLTDGGFTGTSVHPLTEKETLVVGHKDA